MAAAERDEVEDLRDRILRVAADLFARNGYHATGVAEVAEAIGHTRGALYHHFESKEDLLFQISMTMLERMIAQAETLVAEVDGAEEKLTAIARALVREHATRRDAWALVITDIRALTPKHRQKVVDGRHRYEAIWEGVLAEAAAEGWLNPLDELDRRAILGMLNATARWIRLDGPLTPEQVADRHLELLLAGIRAA